nr:hypothetical protein Iba_scaffold10511CG0030 [Ipomoea batatas]
MKRLTKSTVIGTKRKQAADNKDLTTESLTRSHTHRRVGRVLQPSLPTPNSVLTNEGEIKDDIINFHCGSIPECISVRSPIGGGGVSFWVKKAPTAWILPGRHKIVQRRSVPIGIWARIPGLFFHLFYLLLFPSFYQHCCVNFGLRA